MKLKIKRFKKLMITHQLEVMLTLITIISIIIAIAFKLWFLIPTVIILAILILLAPRLMTVGKTHYEKLNLKFLYKSKKNNMTKEKAVRRNKKEVMTAT